MLKQIFFILIIVTVIHAEYKQLECFINENKYDSYDECYDFVTLPSENCFHECVTDNPKLYNCIKIRGFYIGNETSDPIIRKFKDGENERITITCPFGQFTEDLSSLSYCDISSQWHSDCKMKEIHNPNHITSLSVLPKNYDKYKHIKCKYTNKKCNKFIQKICCPQNVNYEVDDISKQNIIKSTCNKNIVVNNHGNISIN